MQRRGFIGALAAVIAAPVVGAKSPQAVPAKPPLRVMRADGHCAIIGIAMETVRVGDFVQIQTAGPATFNVR
jgi:hypothetical protein